MLHSSAAAYYAYVVKTVRSWCIYKEQACFACSLLLYTYLLSDLLNIVVSLLCPREEERSLC